MKTVLIIEDDEALLALCEITLREQGYRVVTATTGESGIELAWHHLPDLILSDIHMPGTDGRNVLLTLRADAEVASCQIVLMTGDTRKLNARKGMELGADDFLVKPFSQEDLIKCVESRLRRADIHWRVEDKVLNGLRGTLGSSLPHEFLAPLTGILGLVEVLRDEITVMNAEEIDDILNDINSSGLRLHRSLKKCLTLLELQDLADEGTPSAAFLDADEARIAVLSAVSAVLHRRQRKDDITVTTAEVRLAVKAPDLSAIADEIVDNACSFSRRGTPVTVDLSANGVLTVTDQGRGMTPDQLQQVGSLQQLGTGHLGQRGLGMGLLLAQKLVRRCGGSLHFESELGGGTTARVSFRTAPP
jgi:CheY-like chemotaxis protein